MSEGSDFLSFRRMITPIIIQIIFWVLAVLSFIVGIGIIIFGVIQNVVGLVLYGLLLMLLGPLVIRIYCEALIVFFRINDTLTEINHKLDRQQQP
jgi:hypothetical protein